MVNIRYAIDHAKCYETVRTVRWPEGVVCPHHSSDSVIKDGKDETEPQRQRYLCHGCRRRFDNLTGTIFAGHHEPLQTGIICLYFMGLNLSSLQIAKELEMNKGDVRATVQQLRQGIVDKRPPVALSGEVECDEVYVVAGHKGHPEAAKKGRSGRRRRQKRRARPWHLGERETTDLRDAPANWRGRHPDVSQCSARHDRPVDPGDDFPGKRGLHR